MQFKFITQRLSNLVGIFLSARYMTKKAISGFGVMVSLTLIAGFGPSPSQAQSLFSPAILVNDQAVTWYELDQRTKFLKLLGAPGDLEKLAREVLIEEKLKIQVIAETEIEVSPEQIEAGIAEFSARTELTPSQFIQALAEGGVAQETIRDFVKMGLLWREYAGARFLEDARPTDAEIDRAIAKDKEPEVQVLLSEIIIPVTPQTEDQAKDLARQISNLQRGDEFADAARRFSAAQTRENGGEMNWLTLGKLPGGLRPMFLAMVPGEISKPVELPNAIAVFRLRAIREGSTPRPRYAQIDYASYFIAGGRSPEALAVAAALRDRIDVCNDLYGVAKGQPPEVLQRQSVTPGSIPRDVALELAKLDPGEASWVLTTNNGQTLRFLMLCERTTARTDGSSREEVARALTEQNFELLANAFLARLEADAMIIDR
ncbi:MAG: peptidylprolyl isomerase [Rhodobacteraceae bacterium]|nr:peptidylprolyl isomerase [Paracoccaceae bacterium]